MDVEVQIADLHSTGLGLYMVAAEKQSGLSLLPVFQRPLDRIRPFQRVKLSRPLPVMR